MENTWTVLVVDDYPGMCQVLEAGLTRAGFLVECYTGGEAAKARIAQADHNNPVGVLVTDLHMPGLSGLALANWTRNHSPHIGVVFITGDDPLPVLPGYRVLAKTGLDMDALVDSLWGALKAAIVQSGFTQLGTKVDGLSDTLKVHIVAAAASSSRVEEAILVCSAAATQACVVSKTAHDMSVDLKKELLETTLATVSKRWWDRLDPLTRGAGSVVVVVVSGLVGSIFMLGSYFARDAHTKVQDILKIQEEVQRDIKPAIHKIETQQTKFQEGQQRMRDDVKQVLEHLQEPPHTPPRASPIPVNPPKKPRIP